MYSGTTLTLFYLCPAFQSFGLTYEERQEVTLYCYKESLKILLLANDFELSVKQPIVK